MADDPAEPRTFEFTAPIRVADDAPEPDTAKFVTPVSAARKAEPTTGPQKPAAAPQATTPGPQATTPGPQTPAGGPQATTPGPQTPAGRATAANRAVRPTGREAERTTAVAAANSRPNRLDEDDTRPIPIPAAGGTSTPAGAAPVPPERNATPTAGGTAPGRPSPAGAAPGKPGPAGAAPARPDPVDNEDTRPIPVPATKPRSEPATAKAESAAAAGPERNAPPSAGREDGFPLWPDIDGPTVPIPAKPRSGPATAKAEHTAGGNDAWQASEIRMMRGGRRPAPINRAPQRPPKRATKKSRRPAVGLTALVLLALLAGFFGWVSADPFWLAVGHAERGTATVTKCLGRGLEARCVGTFTAATFSRDGVAVSALSADQQRPGTRIPARMVSAKGRIAYAGRISSLHLWWIVGIALVLLCGLGISWATGVGRLETRRARLVAFAMSMGGPLLLVAGALAITW